MPEKTAADLRENGFFITGDLGKIDARGYVHIVGRSKDLIISGGYNIYPKEIEQILDDVPGVLESAVIGVPHADFGETVLAVVVLRSGVTLRESDLAAEVAQKLARFKNPKFYQIIAELPRNTMGKVQKNLLRDMYKGFFAAQ
jgi:malonyl-CoA/methylmalonyl-CoA synthetase